VADKVKVDVEFNAGKALAAITSLDDRLTGFTETVGEARDVMTGLVGGVLNFAVRVEQQERALARLGTAYDAVTAATNGAISAQEALTLRGQIQAAGIQVNERALAALTRQAREWADATGNDAAQAIEKLTNAIVNNSEDALSEMNLSMARGATGAQTLSNVVGELERRFAGTAPAARTLAQDLERIPAAFDAMAAAAARALEGPLDQLFQKVANFFGISVTIRQAIREMADAGDALRGLDRTRAGTDAAEARRQQRGRLETALREGRVQISATNRSNFGDLSNLTEQERARVIRAANPLYATGGSITESVNNALREIGDERLSASVQQQQTASARSEMDADVERKQRKPQSTTTDAAAVSAQRDLNRAIAEALVRGAPRVPIGRPTRGETMSDYLQRLTAMQRQLTSGALTPAQMDELAARGAEMDEEAAGTARGKAEAAFAEQRAGTERDRERFQRISGRDRETRSRALSQDRSFGGGVTRAFGLSSDAIRTEMELTDKYASTFVGAVGRMGEAFTRHVGLVVSGQESIGVAFLSVANEVSTSLAQQALPEAMMELARGFAALANPITAPTAPLHFTAAGIFGAVAAGAGVVALGSGAALSAMQGPPGAGAAATGAARAASGSSRGSLTQEQAAPVTVVMSSLVPAGPADAQRARDGLRHARRQGFDDRLPRRIEF